LRDTSLGDSEVGCFSSTKTLTHLYLECPTLGHEERELNNETMQQRQRQRQPLPIHIPIPIYEDHNLAQVFTKGKLISTHYKYLILNYITICANIIKMNYSNLVLYRGFGPFRGFWISTMFNIR